MIKLIDCKLNNFLQYNAQLINNNNLLTVIPVQNELPSGIMIKNILSQPGKYSIIFSINLRFNKKIYLRMADKKIILKNGVNTINIEILPNQNKLNYIGIFLKKKINIDNSFTIYNFSVSNTNFTLYNSFKANKKKKILLVVDVNYWCFYNIASFIKKYFTSFDFTIVCKDDNPDYYKTCNNISFDMVIKFWYGYHKNDPFRLYPDAIKAVCIYDYIYWNKNINKINPITNFTYLKSSIIDSHYVLYACPAIKKLLLQKFIDLPQSKLYPIYDGYDPSKFYYKPYTHTNKLIVGWVGNRTNKYKRFNILENIVKDIDWIELKPQDKDHFIPHEKMVDYYHNIDVLICLSDAEGTPNPIIEAAACGRTWISTNVGIVELLNTITNFPVNPGIIIENYSDLLPNLNFLHNNRPIMEEMGLNGWKSAQKSFQWDTQMLQFKAVFDDAFSEKTID